MTEIEQRSSLSGWSMTPKQRPVLPQAMEDFNAGRCTFEELKAQDGRLPT